MLAEGRRPSPPQSVRTYPALDAAAGLRREYMPICGRLARRPTPAIVGADRPEGSRPASRADADEVNLSIIPATCKLKIFSIFCLRRAALHVSAMYF